MEVNDEQFANALQPIISQVGGRRMELRPWQPWNTPDPTDDRVVEDRSTIKREGQEAKAELQSNRFHVT
ncbi:hypothetical protein TrRE_jg8265 [Triparma retinervis]|uniref:Uncharacterized protein n=1 Tax=Triparma retinervis TaxID=2557542 RepID=A0A9W7FH61_9STRA|nr:hypothetical protein TrRE_jg8265 [Triparma retinervis]